MSSSYPQTTPSKSAPPGSLGTWHGDPSQLTAGDEAVRRAIHDIESPVCLVAENDRYAVARGGTIDFSPTAAAGGMPLIGFAAALRPSQLGDASFTADHAIRFPYMAGSMAGGIASSDLVAAVAGADMLASFGAAGLAIGQIASAIDRLSAQLDGRTYALNLIHSPAEPAHEAATAQLYIDRGVRLVEASAYLDLTLPVVRYRVHGISRRADGSIHTPGHIIAKASRVEVASKWFAPPPAALLAKLVAAGDITNEQAELATRIPMAQDLTAEADSGGHTDNRPAITLLPTMIALRDRFQAQYDYPQPLRVGLAGGIATPASAAAAFAMGAAYIVTGSINQACVESGSSDTVRGMLAETEQADCIMAPAADMFEMGVKLQVLKRGTMFAMRAAKLYELYRTCGSLDEISPTQRASLEKTVFRASLEETWQNTRAFWLERGPAQVERAERDPKHKMALVFRSYLGLSSRWANRGEPDRQIDYQVWCGPAMGAFNEWTRGSFLEQASARRVVDVARNILAGAALVTRIGTLRSQGIHFGARATAVVPRTPDELEGLFR